MRNLQMIVRVGVLAAGTLAIGACSRNNALDGPDVVTMKIDGMACPNCAKHIEHELEEVAGVRAASVDFASSTARVKLDSRRPATQAQLDAAVTAWKTEHFAADEDPDCLDPKRRDEIKRGL